MDAHAGLLHDAVLMWAIAANLTLSQGGSATNDGLNITKNIYNLTFQGWLNLVQRLDKDFMFIPCLGINYVTGPVPLRLLHS